MKLINKTIQANRSGAKAKVVDEDSKNVVVTYLSHFIGTFRYPKEAIKKYWSVV